MYKIFARWILCNKKIYKTKEWVSNYKQILHDIPFVVINMVQYIKITLRVTDIKQNTTIYDFGI